MKKRAKHKAEKAKQQAGKLNPSDSAFYKYASFEDRRFSWMIDFESI